MPEERDFEQFIDTLEDLKGRPPIYRTRAGLTEKIMRDVRRAGAHERHSRWKTVLAPVVVMTFMAAAWLLFGAHAVVVYALPHAQGPLS